MPDNENRAPATHRMPWNKGKLIGASPPLRPKHVWSIRTRLLVEGRIRDLALFNLAIDSKLRGCDVVAIKVEDVAPNGYTMWFAALTGAGHTPHTSGAIAAMSHSGAGGGTAPLAPCPARFRVARGPVNPDGVATPSSPSPTEAPP